MHALIMAGGRASRLSMGEKALTRIADKPLLLYVIDAVTIAGLDPVVVTSPKTPFTTNFCRACGIDWLCASGAGYVEDIREAVLILEIEGPVVTICADLPGISAEHITSLIDYYHSKGCEACSVWVPFDAKESVWSSFEGIPEVPCIPVGLNIIRGDLIENEQKEEKLIIDDPLLTLNINTQKDLINAENLLL